MRTKHHQIPVNAHNWACQNAVLRVSLRSVFGLKFTRFSICTITTQPGKSNFMGNLSKMFNSFTLRVFSFSAIIFFYRVIPVIVFDRNADTNVRKRWCNTIQCAHTLSMCSRCCWYWTLHARQTGPFVPQFMLITLSCVLQQSRSSSKPWSPCHSRGSSMPAHVSRGRDWSLWLHRMTDSRVETHR